MRADESEGRPGRGMLVWTRELGIPGPIHQWQQKVTDRLSQSYSRQSPVTEAIQEHIPTYPIFVASTPASSSEKIPAWGGNMSLVRYFKLFISPEL